MNKLIIKAMLLKAVSDYKEILPVIKELLADQEIRQLLKELAKDTVPLAVEVKALGEEIEQEIDPKPLCPVCLKPMRATMFDGEKHTPYCQACK